MYSVPNRAGDDSFHSVVPLFGYSCEVVGGNQVLLVLYVRVKLGLRLMFEFSLSPNMKFPSTTPVEELKISGCNKIDATLKFDSSVSCRILVTFHVYSPIEST